MWNSSRERSSCATEQNQLGSDRTHNQHSRNNTIMSSLDVYMKESGEIVARLGFMSEEYSWFRCRYCRYYRYYRYCRYYDTVTSIVAPCRSWWQQNMDRATEDEVRRKAASIWRRHGSRWPPPTSCDLTASSSISSFMHYVFIFYIFYIIEGLCNMIALCLFIRPVACDTVLSNVLVIFMLRWLSNTRRPTYSTQYLYLLIWDGISCCRLQRYNYFIEINFTAA